MNRFVYVTYPVTHDTGKLSLIDKIAEILKENAWEPITPDTELSAQELFVRDMECLDKSSFIVSEYTTPSHGVGVETGVAYIKKMPVIGLYEKGKKVSRVVKGAPHIRLIEYESEDDALNKFKLELKKLEISDFIIKMVKETGELLLKNFEVIKEIHYKSSGIYKEYPQAVSSIDIAAEKKIIELISKKYLDHNILGEEIGNDDKGSDYTWIIDSLDGTMQYVRRLPYFSTSIALAYQNEVIFGAVYSPLLNELFYAEKNLGAFLNGDRIKVSQTSELENAFIGSSAYGSYKIAGEENTFLKLFSPIKNIRIYGSPALDLCYVANGRFDARVTSYAEPWDHSAGCFIVEEAGGKVTDWKGNPWSIYSKSLIATNRILHERIWEMMHHV